MSVSSYEYNASENLFDCGYENQTFVNLCFVNASQNCERSKLLGDFFVEIDPLFLEAGLNVSSSFSSIMEIWGETNDGNCTFYQEVLSYSQFLHPDYVQFLLTNGSSNDEILALENELQESVQELIGLWYFCSYKQGDLNLILNDYYQDGPFDAICSIETIYVDELTGKHIFSEVCDYGGMNITGICMSGSN